VLNDHIITLKGLWLYCRFTGDERALKLFNLGIISTKKSFVGLGYWGWTLYSATGSRANENYH